MKFLKYSMLIACAVCGLVIPVSAAGTVLAGVGSAEDKLENNQEEQGVLYVPETEGEKGNSSSSGKKQLPPAPDLDIDSWELVLVNLDNPIGEYEPPVQELEGIPLDYRIVDAMVEFVEDARAEGVPVYLSSGYRDYYTQDYLNQLQQGYGYSKEEADKIVAPAGTSEHQTGLACDITDYYREFKNDELEDTPTYQWMSAHCHEYGFIVRYPKDKEDVTGIIYEPWHYRYVGNEAAEYIMSNGLCLEEFVELYR